MARSGVSVPSLPFGLHPHPGLHSGSVPLGPRVGHSTSVRPQLVPLPVSGGKTCCHPHGGSSQVHSSHGLYVLPPRWGERSLPPSPPYWFYTAQGLSAGSALETASTRSPPGPGAVLDVSCCSWSGILGTGYSDLLTRPGGGIRSFCSSFWTHQSVSTELGSTRDPPQPREAGRLCVPSAQQYPGRCAQGVGIWSPCLQAFRAPPAVVLQPRTDTLVKIRGTKQGVVTFHRDHYRSLRSHRVSRVHRRTTTPLCATAITFRGQSDSVSLQRVTYHPV